MLENIELDSNEKTCSPLTGRVWHHGATMQALPDMKENPLPKNTEIVSDNVKQAAKSVDSIIEERIELGGCEVYISSSFDQPVCPLNIISQLENTNEITRWYYSKKTDKACIVLNDLDTILITSQKVHDESLCERRICGRLHP